MNYYRYIVLVIHSNLRLYFHVTKGLFDFYFIVA